MGLSSTASNLIQSGCTDVCRYFNLIENWQDSKWLKVTAQKKKKSSEETLQTWHLLLKCRRPRRGVASSWQAPSKNGVIERSLDDLGVGQLKDFPVKTRNTRLYRSNLQARNL